MKPTISRVSSTSANLRNLWCRAGPMAIAAGFRTSTVATETRCGARLRTHRLKGSFFPPHNSLTMASTFIADSEAPIVLLLAKKHFEQLPSNEEKLYAHHLSRALHWGTRAVLRSVLPESETIYDLILAIHKKLGSPATPEEYVSKLGPNATGYLEYASQFLSNLGNFKLFGDKKFIPALAAADFDAVVDAVGDSAISDNYKKVREAIFSTEEGLLGWRDQGHLSAYYPGEPVPTKDEIEAVNAALADKGIMPENTRVEKTANGEFVVRVALADKDNNTDYYPPTLEANGAKVTIKFGDHAPEFAHIVEELEKAKQHAANDTQREMLGHYIESFKTGSMNAHKKSQVSWVKDLGPKVELNIGFIETYRDPLGVRGEWEGLVAMVNADRTAKFAELVARAGEFIPQLPWNKALEKDKFTPPDFTSLEVLTFAGLGIPAGINIPNYDDVRLNIGFKNVSLGNVLSANPKNPKKEEVITFLTPEVQEKFRKWRDDAFEVQVGLHELLGHGTGKLLQETSPGKFNFDRSTVKFDSWYKPNETWGSLFGLIAGSYEECRAELVALYLILKLPKEVLPIFGIAPEDFDDVTFIATVLMARAGVVGLEFWDPASKKWGQPHMQAGFAIFKVLHEAGVVSLDTKEANYDDLVITVDPSKLDKVAVDALGNFLDKLHTFKCTANYKEGSAYYNDVTTVGDYAKYRDVVLEKKRPRKQLIQANTVLSSGGEPEIVEYEELEVGMIQSYADRGV